MTSITPNSNFTTDPGFVVLIAIVLLFVLIILSKMYGKYKSTYTVFERVETLDKSLVKSFHEKNSQNIAHLEKIVNNFQIHYMDVLFTEYIHMQDKITDIISSTIEYEYLKDKDRDILIDLQKYLSFNFHNIPAINLKNYSDELEYLEKDLDKHKEAIILDGFSTQHNIEIENFYKDHEHFTNFFKKNSKNAIISKIETFKPLSDFELHSFEDSFSHISSKRNTLDTDVFQLFQLIIELFKKDNAELLKHIKQVYDIQHKITEQKLKIESIENKIDNFQSLVNQLYDELVGLNEETHKITDHKILSIHSLTKSKV